MQVRTALVLATMLVASGLFAAASSVLWRKFRFSRLALVVGCIHLAAVLANAWITESYMLKPGHGEALIGWLWFDLLDFPSSLLGLLISLPMDSFLFREVLLPILFFGVVGSLQYLAIAELSKRIWSRKRLRG